MTYLLSLRTGRCVVTDQHRKLRLLTGKSLSWLRSEVARCIDLGIPVTFSVYR